MSPNWVPPLSRLRASEDSPPLLLLLPVSCEEVDDGGVGVVAAAAAADAANASPEAAKLPAEPAEKLLVVCSVDFCTTPESSDGRRMHSDLEEAAAACIASRCNRFFIFRLKLFFSLMGLARHSFLMIGVRGTVLGLYTFLTMFSSVVSSVVWNVTDFFFGFGGCSDAAAAGVSEVLGSGVALSLVTEELVMAVVLLLGED